MDDLTHDTRAGARRRPRPPPRQRDALRLRHAHLLGRLMATRDDLRGVHALADFVDDAVRWTAE